MTQAGCDFQPPDFTLYKAPDMLPESYQVVPAISRFIAFFLRFYRVFNAFFAHH